MSMNLCDGLTIWWKSYTKFLEKLFLWNITAPAIDKLMLARQGLYLIEIIKPNCVNNYGLSIIFLSKNTQYLQLMHTVYDQNKNWLEKPLKFNQESNAFSLNDPIFLNECFAECNHSILFVKSVVNFFISLI